MKLWKQLGPAALLWLALPLFSQNTWTLDAALDTLRQRSAIFLSKGYTIDTAYHVFMDQTEVADLQQLIGDEDPKVKVLALIGLLKHRTREVLPKRDKLLTYLQDTTSVQFNIQDRGHMYNCSFSIASIFAQKLQIGSPYGDVNMRIHVGPTLRMPEAERALFDSLTVAKELPLEEERAMLLWGQEANPRYYEIIKKQVESGGDDAAVIYLAKYQKPADIPLILANLPTTPNRHRVMQTWFPFEYFQHPELFVYLKSQVAQSWDDRRYLFQIVKYKDEAALAVLQKVYAISPEKSAEKIRAALQQNYASVYADFYIQLLQSFPPSGYISVPDGLWEDKGDDLLKLYDQLNSAKSKHSRRAATYLFEQAMDFTEKYRPDDMATLVLSPIQEGGRYSEYVKSFYYIQQSKNPAFIDPLFALLEKEPEAGNRFFIAKILLDIGDQEVEERLKTFYANNPDKKPTLKAAEAQRSLYKDLSYHGKREK